MISILSSFLSLELLQKAMNIKKGKNSKYKNISLHIKKKNLECFLPPI